MNPHTALGIAQIIFYIPVAPLVIWLMIRNGKIRPRMAWWPLIPFSLSTFQPQPVTSLPTMSRSQYMRPR